MRGLPNGIGEALGDHLLTGKPLSMSGQVWFCSYVSGTDAASPRGLNREAPLKTLGQALTNAADDDIIVLLDMQATVATVTVAKRVCIAGAGLAGGVPTSGITPNFAAGAVLALTVSAVSLRSLKLAAHQQANATDRITVAATDCSMAGCYIECAGNDAGDSVSLNAGADRFRAESTVIISTATSVASRPLSALVNSAALADVSLAGLTVSGGTVGFSAAFAVDLSAAAITRLRADSVSLLLGADMKVNASSTGWVNVQTATGSARMEW